MWWLHICWVIVCTVRLCITSVMAIFYRVMYSMYAGYKLVPGDICAGCILVLGDICAGYICTCAWWYMCLQHKFLNCETFERKKFAIFSTIYFGDIYFSQRFHEIGEIFSFSKLVFHKILQNLFWQNRCLPKLFKIGKMLRKILPLYGLQNSAKFC